MTVGRFASPYVRVAALGVLLAGAFAAASLAADRTPKASPSEVELAVAAAPGIAAPQPEVLLVLIRTTLAALSHAVQTGNFTVLRDLGAPAFQTTNSPTQLGVIFADLQNRKIDLSPVVAVTPQLSEPPVVTPQNVLRLVGYFPTTPLQIKFEMLFQPVNGQWRLLGLGVRCVTAPGTASLNAPAATAASIPVPELAAADSAQAKGSAAHRQSSNKSD